MISIQQDIRRRWLSVEGPTWLLIVAVYTGWFLLTWYYHQLPLWTILPAGAYIVALHGSLQHEILHGHPTRKAWLNDLLVRPALWLWLPYGIYRDSHLAHHRAEWLTCPVDDPESTYILPQRWQSMGRVARWLHSARKTLLGRMVLGPAVAVAMVLRHQLPRLLHGERRAWRQWAAHALAVAPLLFWVLAVCEIPLWAYIAFFAYPGLSLALVRSFAEHRPARDKAQATAIVETSWPLALLYLNNNLHAVHHERPGLPWFALPAAYRAERAAVLGRNGNFVYRGYRELFRRHLVHRLDGPVHPFSGQGA